jgi:hypothetical protein
MSQIEVTITALKELQEAVIRMPTVAANEISKATARTVDVIARNAEVEAPVNKQSGGGNLKQSIRARMTSRFRGLIIAYAKYSAAVHDGSVPHMIRYTKSGKGGLYNKRTGQGFGRVVLHPGTKPNPFFTRAVEYSQNLIQEFVGDALQNIINTIK